MVQHTSKNDASDQTGSSVSASSQQKPSTLCWRFQQTCSGIWAVSLRKQKQSSPRADLWYVRALRARSSFNCHSASKEEVESPASQECARPCPWQGSGSIRCSFWDQARLSESAWEKCCHLFLFAGPQFGFWQQEKLILKGSLTLVSGSLLLMCAGEKNKMVSGSHPVELVESCLGGSSRVMSECRRGEATDSLAVELKAPWKRLTLPFSAPTRSVELAPSLALYFLMVQPAVSDTCLDFSICPSFSVLEILPGLRVTGAKKRLVP